MPVEPVRRFVGDTSRRVEPSREMPGAGKQPQLTVTGSRLVQASAVVGGDHPVFLAMDHQDRGRGALQGLAGVGEVGVESGLKSGGVDPVGERPIGDQRPDTGKDGATEIGDDIAEVAERGDCDDRFDAGIAPGEMNGGGGTIRHPEDTEASGDQTPGLQGVDHPHEVRRFFQPVGQEFAIRLPMTAEVDEDSAVALASQSAGVGEHGPATGDDSVEHEHGPAGGIGAVGFDDLDQQFERFVGSSHGDPELLVNSQQAAHAGMRAGRGAPPGKPAVGGTRDGGSQQAGTTETGRNQQQGQARAEGRREQAGTRHRWIDREGAGQTGAFFGGGKPERGWYRTTGREGNGESRGVGGRFAGFTETDR